MDLAELNLVIRSTQVDQAVSKLNNLAASSRSAANAQTGLLTANSRLENTFNRLSSVVARVSLALGGLLSISKSIEIAADMEQAELAFETMLGTAERAKKMMQELKQFAAATPFQFKGLAENARLLVAMGTTGDKVIPTLRTVGDATAALGGNEFLMERIVLALGQMQAKGKVAGEEMRQLAEAGIPAYDMLAKAIGVTVPTAMQLVENRAFDGITGVNILLDGMARRYAGATGRLALSTKGLFSTLKDNVYFTLGDIGQALIDAFDVQGKLRVAIDLSYRWGQVLSDAVLILGGMPPKFKENIDASEKLALIIKLIAETLTVIIGLKLIEFIAQATVGIVQLGTKIVLLNGYLLPVLTTAASLGLVLASFELGKYLFEDFKAVQIAANNLLTYLQKGWVYVSNAAELAFLAIKAGWNVLLNVLSDTLGTKLKDIGSLFQTIAKGFDKVGMQDAAEGLRITAEQLDKWGAAAQKAFAPVDSFNVGAFENVFNVVTRLVTVDNKAPAIRDAWKEVFTFFDPEQNGGNRSIDSLESLNMKILNLITRLGEEGSQTSLLAAQRISEEWEKGLKNFGTLPLDLGQRLSNTTRDQQLKMIDAVKAAREKEIDSEFGTRTSKDGSYTSTVAADLQKLMETIKQLTPGMGNLSVSASQLEAIMGKISTTTQGQIEGLDELKARLAQYRNDVEELTDKYKAEREALDQGQLQRDLEVQTLKAEQYLLQHHIENKAEIIRLLRQEITLLAQARFAHEIDNKILDERDARIGIGLSDKEAEVEKKLREAQRKADEAGVVFDETQQKKYRAEIEATQQAQEAWERWKNASKSLASGIGDTIDSILLRTSSLTDALQSLAQLAEKIAIQTFISGPLSSFLAGAFQGAYPGPASAHGNVFSRGEMVSFGSGGVFDSPHTFQMRDGRRAQFAEAGPEAIMPLQRTATGRLGVAVAGGNTGGGTNIGSVNIYSNNPDNFRRSEGQIARILMRASRRVA